VPSSSFGTRLLIRARGAAERTFHLLGLELDAVTLGARTSRRRLVLRTMP
jgi:hypothetical protein